MFKTFECLDCNAEHVKVGRNQKRCPECARAAKKMQIKAAAIRTGKFTGTGSGAHNTPEELHPRWQGGERRFSQVLAPAYYKKVRYCERCSKDLLEVPPDFKSVHHKDHNRKNNIEDNFELLCKRCHQVEHECWKNLPNNRSD